jgi:antitoxin ParD1/3/4
VNVSLTPELEHFIGEKVESGMYTSASEVVREGLRLLREQDELRRIRMEDLRREVTKGHTEAGRGESQTLDINGIKAEGRRRLNRRSKV